MKRVLFVSIANLYVCPYIQKYIDAIGDRAEYDIVYWNRHGVEEGSYGAQNTYVFHGQMGEFVSKATKLIDMIRYCRFAAKVIRKNHYDRIIMLHSNAAVPLYSLLTGKYKGRYLYDIRDYSFERFWIFRQIQKGLVKNAAATVISSDGFREFLPDSTYQLVHNNVKIDPAVIKAFREDHQGHNPVRVSFVGMVRFFEQGKRLAAHLGKDSRFRVNYFGKNANLMQKAIGDCDNHFYTDQFPPEKTLEFYQETDLINNVYGNHNPSVDYLTSNKLYYCALLGLPILVSPETFMAQLVEKYGLGFVFDFEDKTAADRLYAYYENMDWAAFHARCDAFCREVEEDDRNFDQLVKNFIA